MFSIPLQFGLSHADADDVAQHTFTALLRSLNAIEDEARLGSWLATVARRQTWRVVERRRRETPNDHAALDRIASDDDSRRKVEQLEWLHQGLVQMDERCRNLITSLYFDDGTPSYESVAERFGIPVGSIGPTRARCLQKLRAALESLEER